MPYVVKKLINIPKPITRQTQPDWTMPNVSTGTFTCTSNIYSENKKMRWAEIKFSRIQKTCVIVEMQFQEGKNSRRED